MGPFLQRRLSLAGQLGVCMGLLTPVPIHSRPQCHFHSGTLWRTREALGTRMIPIQPDTCAPISVVETQCVKVEHYKGHYKLVKDGECAVFLVL
jgi:hypothetical protein